MDEKIRQAFDDVINRPTDDVSLSFFNQTEGSVNTKKLALGFILGYRVALDALPSREEIKEAMINCPYEIDKDGVQYRTSDMIAAAIDTLIRRKV